MIKPEKQNVKREEVSLIRILSTDIPGNLNVYAGLTRIKGVSWSMSNGICHQLNLERTKKVSNLSKEEIEKISEFIKKPNLPVFLLNRRKDRETGEDKHVTCTDLDLNRELDIKRFRKIKSYRGLRHALGQPVRGQRTRSHFRKNKTVGVQKKAKVGKKG